MIVFYPKEDQSLDIAFALQEAVADDQLEYPEWALDVARWLKKYPGKVIILVDV